MSTQNRTGGGGRNQKKSNVNSGGGGGGDTTVSNKKSDVSKPEKEKTQPKPTAEQIRIAQITDISSGSEDPEMREKVQTLIEMTQRSEEEVCCALNECDNNLEKAVEFLLETLPVGAFETSSKKKKNRVANSTNDGNGDGEWTENNANVDNRERSRNRNGMRGGRGGSDSRGWRSREARENERNAADSKGGEGGGWRGRGRGGSRGGYGGRGGRGGRMGPRGMGSRDQGRNYSRQEPQEVDTWDNTIATNAEQIKQDDEWGDWDNEEYVGSLKDSKVFIPSSLQNQPIPGSEISVPPGLEPHILNQPPQMSAEELVQQYSSTVVSNTTPASSAAAVNSVQFPDMHSNNASHNLRLTLESQQLNATSTLSAEQSQYFNSLPSQNATQQPNYNAYQTSSPSSYVSNTVFGDQGVSSQPAVRRARAKLPPPSKIPSSAVEMPGDTLNNIGYLDVQFGGLDFGTEDSFDRLTEKFNATSIDSQQNVQSQDVSNDYQSKSNVQQSSLSAGLQSSQIISNSDTLSSTQNDNLTSGYTQRGVSSANVQQSGSNVGVSMNNSTNSTLDQLSKSDPYNQSNTSNANVYQSSYSSNATTNKTPSYQPSGAGQGYNSTNYTNSQSASSSTYQPSSNNYNAYNQNSVNSYQTQSQTSVNSSTNSVSGVSGGSVSNSSSAQNIPVGGGTGTGGANSSTVNSASSNTSAGYLSSQYQSNQTTSAFPSQQSAYQNSQSVYGNTGVSSVTSSGTVSSTVSSATTSSATTNNLSSPSLGLTNTKVTNSAAKSSAGIVPNVQMVSQFIQTGLPYFQQPAVYSYEDLQIMQQRMPHVTQYYDLNYPATSLGASGVRDANLSVAYSTMTDGRFARTDNNSSPVSNVSSTLSQQAGSSGAMLNVPYAYFYNANMMPGSFQYGTPAIYPQQMPTANATSGGQFPKPSYNSGYGSTSYDALSQATKDYNKGYIEYPASGVGQQSKAQNVTNPPQASSGSDISSSMYGKSHVALNKVNSYEKQSFHSGTPPPFNLTGTQTAGATSAQSYGVYIQPMPPAHHTMNLHQPIHQMDGRMHNSSRRDSNSTGQRPQPNSQSKTGTKQGYSPSYWTAQN
ncbi:unnamed protein product [Hermetia illucens]|uniref:Protein lingerer n=1 Tax=Hermetia illucens TaxID=343691 RepID=A0A7R8YLW4_HERIL|nr:protein lingerer isoform X4 [Hermetia illucens]CAD7076827.1 unnamed protein product [Hermetia illucens]